MEADELPERLSQIKTLWSELFRAHQDNTGEATDARCRLLLRYHGAVYRYLHGLLRKASGRSPAGVTALAEDLTQEFAVRFLRGDFRGADPGRGRFRDFLKQALRNLVTDCWRQQQHAPGALPADGAAEVPACPPAAEDMDQEFLASWRKELFHHTWEALQTLEEESGQLYHTVLLCKSEHPKMRSAQLAVHLRPQLGKELTEKGMRQTLHRARQKFADLLVEEVARAAQSSDPEVLEQELRELDLFGYCQAALERRRRPD
jgi:DNA-directed RNA polymerase specialized sigma24 family protein